MFIDRARQLIDSPDKKQWLYKANYKSPPFKEQDCLTTGLVRILELDDQKYASNFKIRRGYL
jgi:hypothetical protein